MSSEEKLQEVYKGNASKVDQIIAKQKQDQDSNCLSEFASKNTVPAYADLSPMTSMREKTKEFPNDSNDYKARLHDIAWSSQNDIAFVGQANDLVVCIIINIK